MGLLLVVGLFSTKLCEGAWSASAYCYMKGFFAEFAGDCGRRILKFFGLGSG
jgi:hypothetical protein